MRTIASVRTPVPSDNAVSAPKTDSFVRFHNVRKSYDGRNLVVKGLNLDIRRSEFLTMLGPSGSGKTTCLMMLAGFETATAGEILLDGRPINRIPPERRNIGMVFQNYALFPHMSVRDNLAFPLRVRRVSRDDIGRKVDRALEMVNLNGLGDRMPGQLSGGQQQRVAVARALVFEPSLVLMDEPLGALDKQLREQMQYEIKRIHETLGVTVVYVTHDQDEALTMSDRVAIFKDGVIQQLASPRELYERPNNAFVAQFIGENNQIPGTVRAIDGDGCLVESANGDMIRAIRVASAGVGDPVKMSLRPERVQLDPRNSDGINLVTGTIRDVVYHGDHLRVIVAACGVDPFIVKLQNCGLSVVPEIGQAVRLGWKVVDCHALQ